MDRREWIVGLRLSDGGELHMKRHGRHSDTALCVCGRRVVRGVISEMNTESQQTIELQRAHCLVTIKHRKRIFRIRFVISVSHLQYTPLHILRRRLSLNPPRRYLPPDPSPPSPTLSPAFSPTLFGNPSRDASSKDHITDATALANGA